VDRYSFLVGILPPLLHAGLARRTDMAIYRQLLDCNKKATGSTE
jgi:hypothetical protein